MNTDMINPNSHPDDAEKPFTVAVIDYGIGNLRSAQKALQAVGADAVLTSSPKEIMDADAIVLPGVGAYGRCIEALHETKLFDVAYDAAQQARLGGKPFLGICVGMQMLFSESDESPGVKGLAIYPEVVELLSDSVKRPQMQWNTVLPKGSSALASLFANETWQYFVHSFAVKESEVCAAECDYGTKFVAAIAENNLWATQFHPEKSGQVGLLLLKSFITKRVPA